MAPRLARAARRRAAAPRRDGLCYCAHRVQLVRQAQSSPCVPFALRGCGGIVLSDGWRLRLGRFQRSSSPAVSCLCAARHGDGVECIVSRLATATREKQQCDLLRKSFILHCVSEERKRNNLKRACCVTINSLIRVSIAVRRRSVATRVASSRRCAMDCRCFSMCTRPAQAQARDAFNRRRNPGARVCVRPCAAVHVCSVERACVGWIHAALLFSVHASPHVALFAFRLTYCCTHCQCRPCRSAAYNLLMAALPQQ